MPLCKDCAKATSRDVKYPGPRCGFHHRAVIKARKTVVHERRVQAIYGLAPGEYDRLYAAQGSVCALCKKATGKTKKLAVDHQHETGKVRGLLCGRCNYNLLGIYGDDPQFYGRVAAYLRGDDA